MLCHSLCTHTHICRPKTHFQYTLSTKTKRFFIRYVLMRFFLDVVVCQLQMFCYFLYACWHVCICWVQHTKPVWIVAALVRCRGKLFFFVRTMEKVYAVPELCFVVFGTLFFFRVFCSFGSFSLVNTPASTCLTDTNTPIHTHIHAFTQTHTCPSHDSLPPFRSIVASNIVNVLRLLLLSLDLENDYTNNKQQNYVYTHCSEKLKK